MACPHWAGWCSTATSFFMSIEPVADRLDELVSLE
jgi:hypothetical protein